MNILNDISKLSSAEDFFDYFNLNYDENIIKPYRLHILKKFRLYMDEELSKNPEEQCMYNILRECLRKAYEDFVVSSPIQQRLFKVHKSVFNFIDLEVKKNVISN